MIELDTWRAMGRHFKHGEHSIFYVDSEPENSSKEVLLLVHGFPTASWDWELMWPELTQRFRCVAPDMIGFGFSDKPKDHHYTIHDQADLHETLLSNLKIERAHILAHDYGDTVAQELLARFLEREATASPEPVIQSLCFLNGGLFPETHRARFVQKLLNSSVGWLVSRMINRSRFERGLSIVFGENTKPSERHLQGFWDLLQHNDGNAIGHKLIRYIRDRKQHRARWVAALQNATLPIRLINGEADPVSGVHMTERYAELVTNPDIVLLDGIGHYPQVESPEGVLSAFLEFIDVVNADTPMSAGQPTA